MSTERMEVVINEPGIAPVSNTPTTVVLLSAFTAPLVTYYIPEEHFLSVFPHYIFKHQLPVVFIRGTILRKSIMPATSSQSQARLPRLKVIFLLTKQ